MRATLSARLALCLTLLAAPLCSPPYARAQEPDLPPVCRDAFAISSVPAPPQTKADLYARCLDTGQLSAPVRAMMLFNRGNMLRRLGKNDQALADYAEAIRLDKPNLFEAYNNRGALLVELGRYAEALPDFAQAIVLRPDEAFAYCNRGYALARLGRRQEAVADFDRALELDPAYAYAFFGRAQVREAQGLYALALDDYGRALKAAPAYAPAANSLAWLLASCPVADLRDGRRAVALAQRAVELQKDHRHLDTLAAAQARAEMYAEAVKTEEEALGLLGGADASLRPAYEKRLELYRAGRPYAEPAPKP